MALLGIKHFEVHFEGKWLADVKKYIGGNSLSLDDVDGDEFCFNDLIKDIQEKTTLSSFRVLWVKDGVLCVVSNDTNLLYM